MTNSIFPMGHFYNPVPSEEDIERFIANRPHPRELPGIDLNYAVQQSYHKALSQFQDGYVWKPQKQEGLDFYWDNDQFTDGCSYTVYAFLRLVRPARVIEVGSGYSTAIMEDTNRLYLDRSMKITCIEPYPDRLYATWGDRVEEHVKLYRKCLQDVDLSLFDELQSGDLCFIDSSHVAKLGSDVCRIFFELLPRLKEGVYIHFHDILYPFEYPDAWLRENRAWNEAYMLRAFLENNPDYEILYWGTCLMALEESLKDRNLGGSIWLRKKKKGFFSRLFARGGN